MNLKATLQCTTSPPTVLLLDGLKGGCGKSFVARIVAYEFDRHQQPWEGLDGDNANAHLNRFAGRGASVSRFDGSHPTEAYDAVLDAIGSTPHSILVDLPAGIGSLEASYPMMCMATAASGHRILRMFVMTDGHDAVQQLSASAPSFPHCDTVAVLNKRSAKADDFALWYGSKTRHAMLAGGGREISFPRLHEPTQKFADNKFVSFAELLELPDMPTSVRFNLRHFLNICSGQLDPLLQFGNRS